MSEGPNLPQPPSDDEISERLRRAVERASGRSSEDPDEDPFTSLKRELEDIPLHSSETESLPSGPPVPEHDPGFASQMNSLNERMDKLRTKRTEEVKNQERTWKSEQDANKGLGVGLTIAYMFLGLPIVGVVIGWAIDHFTGGHLGIPICGFIGIVVGCVFALKMLTGSSANK